MLIFLLLMFLTTFLYLRLDFSAPICIHLIPWIIVFCFGVYYQNLYIKINNDAYIILLSWIMVVFITLLCFALSTKDIKSPPCYVDIPYKYSSVLMIVVILSALKVRTVASVGGMDFAHNLRSASISAGNNSEANLGWVLRIQPLMFVLLFREYLRPQINKLNFGLLVLYSIILAVGTMSKFAIFSPVLGLIILKVRKTGINLSRLLIFATGLLFLLIVLQTMRGSGNQLNIVDLLGIYVYSPIIAFSNAIQTSNVHADYFGMNTFQFFYKVSPFFIDNVPSPSVASSLYGFWSFVPYPTNVYTILMPTYVDFGYLGIILFGILYGAIFGWVYKQSYFSMEYLIIYAYISQSLFMQIFDETLFRALSANLQVIFWAFLIKKLTTSPKLTFKVL